MNKVIGGGPTGRLFIHLREEKGYTYSAGSNLAAGQHRGTWQASTSVRTEVTGPALQDLLAEIARLREEPVPEQELSEAKRSMVAAFALSLESLERLLDHHVTRWRYRLPIDYWDRYAERVMSIGPDVIQRMARRYLSADRLQIVAVGDPAGVADTLKKLGEVQTYDTEGKVVAGGW
jgi:predicted Zn-dependent peptidase